MFKKWLSVSRKFNITKFLFDDITYTHHEADKMLVILFYLVVFTIFFRFMIKIDFHNKRLTKLNHDQDGHIKEIVFIVVILKAIKVK